MRLGLLGMCGQGALLNRQGQTVAGLDFEVCSRVHAGEQASEFFAAYSSTGGHDANTTGTRALRCGFERGLDTNQDQMRVVCAQLVNSRGCGRVTGHHQSLDMVLFDQVLRNRQ